MGHIYSVNAIRRMRPPTLCRWCFNFNLSDPQLLFARLSARSLHSASNCRPKLNNHRYEIGVGFPDSAMAHFPKCGFSMIPKTFPNGSFTVATLIWPEQHATYFRYLPPTSNRLAVSAAPVWAAILTLNSADRFRGTLKDFHSDDRKCFARKTICPT